jgi:hypothetical protein
MRRRRISPLLGGGIVATLLSKSTVHADPFGQDELDGTGAFADSSLHTYCFTNPPEWGGASVWGDDAMAYLEGYTDMDTVGYASCAASDDAWLDIKDLSGATRGQRYCRVALDAAGACDSNAVEVDTQQIFAEAWTFEPGDWLAAYERNVRKTLQHEIGHSVGMTHHGGATADLEGNGAPFEWTGCMVSGHVTDPYSVLYGEHHKDHVNNAY